jgi:hypothetical protein
MTIYKTIITVTVLSDTPLEFDDLAELEHAISYGDCVGMHEVGTHQVVDPQCVSTELLALGNDGTFFDSLDEEEQS